MRNREEAEEVIAAGRPRSDAVARLFADHNAALVRFLRLRLDSDQEARDVAQEAYVRLLQLDQPGAVSFLRAFLFRTATNLAIDRMRRRAVRRTNHSDPAFDAGFDELDPERALSAREQLQIVNAALQELPERVRAAFLLHRVDGLRVPDVGDRLGVNERTVRNYIVQAMVHCRLRLGELAAEDGQ